MTEQVAAVELPVRGGWVELLTGPPDGARVVERAGAMFVPGDYVRVAPSR